MLIFRNGSFAMVVQSGLSGQCGLSATTAVFSVPYPGSSFTIHPSQWYTVTLTLTNNEQGIQLLANIPEVCSGYAARTSNGAEKQQSAADAFTAVVFGVLLLSSMLFA